MGWELRGNQFYFYAKKRVGTNKVTSVYVGTPRIETYLKSLKTLLHKELKDECKFFFEEIDTYLKATWVILKDYLLASGFHQYQGYWRKFNKLTLQKQPFLDEYLACRANPAISRDNITQALNTLSKSILFKLKLYPIKVETKESLFNECYEITIEENYNSKPTILKLLLNAFCLGLLKYKFLTEQVANTYLDSFLGIYKAHLSAKRANKASRELARLYKYYNFLQANVTS